MELKKIFNIAFIKFLFVAGINTCFGYLVFAAVVFLLKNVYVSVVVSNIISILFNFRTYGRIVFNSKDYTRVYRFFGVYILLILLQMGSLKVFARFGLTNPYIVAAIIMLPLAGLSFLLMRQFVFNKVAENAENA